MTIIYFENKIELPNISYLLKHISKKDSNNAIASTLPKMKRRISNYQGFTLIELLVVIAIIGILSTLAIVALGSARQKSRDSKRVADLNQIGKALELYYSDNNAYPTIITTGQPISFGSTTYLSQVPSNPAPRNDGSCPNQDYQYYLITATNTYVIGGCTGAATGSFQAGPIGYSAGQGLLNCGGSLTDRDGYVYRTVQLGGQCWMVDNLKTKTTRTGSTISASDRTCNGAGNVLGTETDCSNGYTLYTWAGIMGADTTEGSQGICPDGWHVPSDTELTILSTLLTNSGFSCDASLVHGIYSCDGASTKMLPGGSSGLNVVPAGYYNGGFSNRDTNFFIWTSTSSGGSAWSRRYNSSIQLQHYLGAKTMSLVGRCIKN